MTAVARMPMHVRLALMVGVVLAATIVLLLVAVGTAVDRVLVAQTAERLEIGAGLLVDQRRNGTPVTDLAASDVAGLLGGQGTAVTIVGPDGAVLGAVDNDASIEVAAVRLDPTGYAEAIGTGLTSRTILATPSGRVLVVAAPIRLSADDRGGNGGGNGRGQGSAFVPPGQAKKGATPAPDASAAPDIESGTPNAVAQLAVSLVPVDQTISELRQQLAVLGVTALVIGLGAVLFVTARATRPLERIVDAAARLADGDLTARTGLSGPDEIASVGAAFDAMADRLQSAFQAERAFAADASHEIRTPLAVLGGYVDLLRRDGIAPEERRRLLSAMRQEIDRLARLASDLLLLARLEAGAPALQPRDIDLADLVREQAEAARVLAPAGVGVVAMAEGPLPIHADPDRIAQVLRNLVDNAIRHAEPGTPIIISADADGPTAVARVTNTGRPIDPEVAGRLFERFSRGGAPDLGATPDGHAGLGLSIGRAIVEASGGTIVVESGGVTTTFSIRLAMARVAASQPLLSEPGPVTA